MWKKVSIKALCSDIFKRSYDTFIFTQVRTFVHFPLLTGFPVLLRQQMFPSTEPIRTRPVDPLGEEKNGTSLRYDHRTSPLSWDSGHTQMCEKIPQ